MKIKVKKELPNNNKGPILLMVVNEKTKAKKVISASPGQEIELDDVDGHTLLGKHPEFLEVVSYGKAQVKSETAAV